MAEIGRSLAAYYEFLQGKERAGIERAVLSNTFGLGEFGPGMYRKFIQLVSEQNSYLATFQIYAAQEMVDFFKQLETKAPFKEVMGYREKAFSNQLNQSAEAWFKASTERINLLKEQEELLTTKILSRSEEVVDTQTTEYWASLVLSVLIISVSSYFSLMLLRGV